MSLDAAGTVRPNGEKVKPPQCVARWQEQHRCDKADGHKERLHVAALPPLPGRDEPRVWSWL